MKFSRTEHNINLIKNLNYIKRDRFHVIKNTKMLKMFNKDLFLMPDGVSLTTDLNEAILNTSYDEIKPLVKDGFQCEVLIRIDIEKMIDDILDYNDYIILQKNN